jgi:hypothetical protein
MTKRILIYSPDLIGHPRIYCRAIADALREQDSHLIFALGYSSECELVDCEDLIPLANRPEVTLVDLRDYSHSQSTHLSTIELLDVQKKLAVDITLFIEADKFKDEFIKIALGKSPQLAGKNIGIFAKTSEWIPGEDSFTGETQTLLAPTIRTTLGNIKRAVFCRKRSMRYFYEQQILKKNVLQELWVKDERLSEQRPYPVCWMPEISRPFAADTTPADDYEIKKSELEGFLEKNNHLEPYLFFGDAAYYKGYDIFLKFIEQNENICAFHTGRTYDAQQHSYFQYDVEHLRKKLKQQGRLFETNEYVSCERLKKLYFSSIKVYLTTHRLALSSSTMIQALELSIPILVPDRGLLAHRVKQNKLGMVYKYEDIEDLSEKSNSMRMNDLAVFEQNAHAFWQRFSEKNIKAFLVDHLLECRSM